MAKLYGNFIHRHINKRLNKSYIYNNSLSSSSSSSHVPNRIDNSFTNRTTIERKYYHTSLSSLYSPSSHASTSTTVSSNSSAIDIPTKNSITIQYTNHYIDIIPNHTLSAPFSSYRLHNMWLRDHCLCSQCTHPITLQRCLNTQKLSIATTIPKTVTYDHITNTLTIVWLPNNLNTQEHTSIFTLDWLNNHAYKIPLSVIHKLEDAKTHNKSVSTTDIWKSEYTPNPLTSSDSANDTSSRVLWDASTFKHSTSLPSITKENILTDDKELYKGLLHIRDQGFVCVTGVEPTIKGTEEICRRFSPLLRATLYGSGMWTTHIARDQNNINDTAFTAAPLDPHTDGNYFQDSPGIQVFHAIEADPNGGGDSLLVDGFRIAQEIMHSSPELFYILSHLYIPYHHTDPDYKMLQKKRVFTIKSDYLYNHYQITDPWYSFPKSSATSISSSSKYNNQPRPSFKKFIHNLPSDIKNCIESIHFNNDDRAPITNEHIPLYLYELYGTETIIKIYEAIQLIQSYITNPQYILRFGLRPGTVLLFNNNRVLHGRTGFVSNSPRTLAGCYINEEDWKSQLRIIEKKIRKKKMGNIP